MAAEHGSGHGTSPTDYIGHHMDHLTVGEGFWTFHVDTLFMSALCAGLVAFMLWRAARAATSGVPSKYVGFIELVFEFVDNQVSEMYHGDRRFITAMAPTLSTWTVAMTSLDLLPVALAGKVAAAFGADHWRALPTADLNCPLAIAIVALAPATL